MEPECIRICAQYHSAQSEYVFCVLFIDLIASLLRGLTLDSVPAQVLIPAAHVDDVTESGQPLTQVVCKHQIVPQG
jgi:hypothetical protein